MGKGTEKGTPFLTAKKERGRNGCLDFGKGTRQERVSQKWGTVNALVIWYVKGKVNVNFNANALVAAYLIHDREREQKYRKNMNHRSILLTRLKWQFIERCIHSEFILVAHNLDVLYCRTKDCDDSLLCGADRHFAYHYPLTKSINSWLDHEFKSSEW